MLAPRVNTACGSRTRAAAAQRSDKEGARRGGGGAASAKRCEEGWAHLQRARRRAECGRTASGERYKPARLEAFEKSWEYAENTCAADGMCQEKCPVKINTGELVKSLRHDTLEGVVDADGPTPRAAGPLFHVATLRLLRSLRHLHHGVLRESVQPGSLGRRRAYRAPYCCCTGFH